MLETVSRPLKAGKQSTEGSACRRAITATNVDRQAKVWEPRVPPAISVSDTLPLYLFNLASACIIQKMNGRELDCKVCQAQTFPAGMVRSGVGG